ncbi:TetR/AcrR family transcriptional regulator [Paucihalobacter ruber]|uniref:TetR/AcrR family transcriptional regulator n=1 Tax=Paucihalobacter ruber TaxID=2567861 RepID=A0A506PHT6_9FLAO|nr:TetR/AcrR family transcriptional regulator [Paucihalobacter ruber]TPV32945.1 TetR/AcrR family transcriptional regulator [Paucihalobacter ruber]
MTKHKDNQTEDQILKAAQIIFQTKGMDGARMQEIADKASINKAMLHYYYRSKQLLFEAVFNKAFSLLAPELNRILNDSSSIEEKIKNFTDNYISFMIKHPYLPGFIIQELNRNPKFIEKLESNVSFPDITKFKNQVKNEIENGTIIPISAEQLFINILSLNVFPFVASPLIKALVNVDDTTYQTILEARKEDVSNFLINAIKK